MMSSLENSARECTFCCEVTTDWQILDSCGHCACSRCYSLLHHVYKHERFPCPHCQAAPHSEFGDRHLLHDVNDLPRTGETNKKEKPVLHETDHAKSATNHELVRLPDVVDKTIKGMTIKWGASSIKTENESSTASPKDDVTNVMGNTARCVQDDEKEKTQPGVRAKGGVTDEAQQIRFLNFGKTASAAGPDGRNGKTHSGLRVRRYTEEPEEESKEKGEGKDRVDFGVNDKGDLCIRFNKTSRIVVVQKPKDSVGGEKENVSRPKNPHVGSKNESKGFRTDEVTMPKVVSPTTNVSEDIRNQDDFFSVRVDADTPWCIVCVRFGLQSYVTYVCFGCSGRFCTDCARRHEHGITPHIVRQDCIVHASQMAPPKAVQCNNCAFRASQPSTLKKTQKTAILGTKGWRTNRFQDAEASDKKLRQLQDKHVIRLCKRNFNFQGNKVEHPEDVGGNRESLMSGWNIQAIPPMKERDQTPVMDADEDDEMQKIKVDVRKKMAMLEKTMQVLPSNKDLKDHYRKLREVDDDLKVMEEKDVELDWKKERIIEEKEKFIQEVKDQSRDTEIELAARVAEKREHDEEFRAALAEAEELLKLEIMDEDSTQRLDAVQKKIAIFRERAHREKQELNAFCEEISANSKRQRLDIRRRFNEAMVGLGFDEVADDSDEDDA